MRRLLLGMLRMRILRGMRVVRRRSPMGFVELLGPVRSLKLMTLARHGTRGNSQQQNGEKFHLAAS